MSFDDKIYSISYLENLTCIDNKILWSLLVLVTFLLISNYFGLLSSKTRQQLQCNLLFGLTGYFGPLKDVNVSFFLSRHATNLSESSLFRSILFGTFIIYHLNSCKVPGPQWSFHHSKRPSSHVFHLSLFSRTHVILIEMSKQHRSFPNF